MPTIEKSSATSVAAYDIYLIGLHKSLAPGPEALQDASRCFELATKLDPDFSLAYSAQAYLNIFAGGLYAPFKEVGPPTRQLAAKALELDPDSPDAHVVQGMILHQMDLDWANAERELRLACKLGPSHLNAHFWYSALLAAVQRYEEAKEQIREALRLNPGSNHGWNWLAICHYLSGDLRLATDVAETIRSWDPAAFAGHLLTGYCYAATGRVPDALKEADLAVGPTNLSERVNRAVLYALLGKPAEAELLAKELEARSRTEFVPEIWRADLGAVLGRKDEALDLLEHDYREGEKALWLDYQFPQFDNLRGDPRFGALLRKYNLPNVQAVRLSFASSGTVVAKGPVLART